MWGEGGDHYRRLLNLGHIFFKKGYDTFAIHSPLIIFRRNTLDANSWFLKTRQISPLIL